jgi:small conductance mechanosensitive channel
MISPKRLFPLLIVLAATVPALNPAAAQTLPTATVPEVTSAPMPEPASDAKASIPFDVPPAELSLRLLPMTPEELSAEADAWVEEIQRQTSLIVDGKVELLDSTIAPERKSQLEAQLTELSAERRTVFKGFDEILKAWESKGGEPEKIAGYRKFVSALRAEELKATHSSTVWKSTRDWLFASDGGIRIAKRVLVFSVALVFLFMLARLVSRLVSRAVHRYDKFSTLLDRFLVKLSFWGVMVIGALTVLSWMGVHMTPLLTVFGGLSFVVAFAMQSTLSNFAAGLMIMVYRPFDVGNLVTVGGVTGTVRAMSLVSTTLVTGDNQVIVVPNSNVWGSIITNVNVSDQRRVDMTFGIGYQDDEAAAGRILEEIVSAHPLVLKDPAPVIRLHQLADSSVNFICRPWAKTSDYWTVYWDITRQVKDRFDAAGISIPFPQREVHVQMLPAPEARKQDA